MNKRTNNYILFVLKCVERTEVLKLKKKVLEWDAAGRRRKGRSKKNGCSRTENELPRTARKRN
jgi:hypothetical protein